MAISSDADARLVDRRWLLLLIVLPTCSSLIWWVGVWVVGSNAGGGNSGHPWVDPSPDFHVLAILAAVPALFGMGWSVVMDDLSFTRRVCAFVGVAFFTALAIAVGLVIVFAILKSHCPPDAYECPI